MNQFKIRASAGGKIMTNPRSKSELISKTTISYVHDWLKESIYGVKKDFTSKYTEKGTLLEDEGIDKAITWLDLPLVLKNETRFEDEYFTGSPDLILEDEIIDIKLPWDAFTFPLFEDELPEKDYFYQVQIYMHLTGKKKARVVFLLLNTPEEIAKWETHHDYSAVPIDKRWKAYPVEYDPAVIADLQERVGNIREYIKTIKI